MLRITANGSFRLGVVMTALVMISGLGADVAEAKRGLSVAKAAARAALKSGSQEGDAANAADGSANAADAASGEKSAGVTSAATPSNGKSEPIDKDYYGRRADGILKEEDGVLHAKPHPLAAAHPGMDVVVCEGGCNEVPAEIVFMRPTTYKPKTAEQLAAEKAAQSGARKGQKIIPPSAPGTPASKDIVCLGGCYDTPGIYTASTSREMQPVALGEWMTSVTPTSATPAKPGSGDWMRKIDAARPEAPAEAPKN